MLVLSFNVRGFDSRWQEVFLLTTSYDFDVLILLETGSFDHSVCAHSFPSFTTYTQEGENKNGGVLIMVRRGIHSSRVKCDVPNVCVIDIYLQDITRIIGVYAPESRSWVWDQLSPFVSSRCILYGDFNVDLDLDGSKADALLLWADSLNLAPFVTDDFTSKRADRKIDYALSNHSIDEIYIHSGNTTSDHRPIISTLQAITTKLSKGKAVHWKVFTLFTEFVYDYWNLRWQFEHLNNFYADYVHFLALLTSRCTVLFPLQKYRIAIPPELRSELSLVRALSFKQLRTRDPQLKLLVNFRRRMIKIEIKRFVNSQLADSLNHRFSASPRSVSFWSKVKRGMHPNSSNLKAIISPSGFVEKNPAKMCELAADHYESLFRGVENVVRPHPYLDSPIPTYDNTLDEIPPAKIEELTQCIFRRKMKKSEDAHGISHFMLKFLNSSHWSIILELINRSFATAHLPIAWKDTRMLLLAKKDSICPPDHTRPISLLDTFQKITEKLFLSRFKEVLANRGILPPNQSGFREGYRLQTRLLLFLDDLSSMMSNSAPTATLFVDYKSAFDMMWHAGCLAKLARVGIPQAYVTWIATWLADRRGFVEIKGIRSRWFNIDRGSPQGGVLSPTLFVAYHADLPSFLACCTSHIYADDLAAVMSGQMGIKYALQCLDLEKRVACTLTQLDQYATLTAQPLNLEKTVAMWSARAIGRPPFEAKLNDVQLQWVSAFKYLGYWVCPKLGWGPMLKKSKLKIRQRIASINTLRISGTSSTSLRRALFASYILPLFEWLYPIFPLLTRLQRNDLDHFYLTCLKRTLRLFEWSDEFLSFAIDEISLSDRCARYWSKYLEHLSDSEDGSLLLERSTHATFRQSWVDGHQPIKCLRRSRRFVSHSSIIEKALAWCSEHTQVNSIPAYDIEDVMTLALFPESF